MKSNNKEIAELFYNIYVNCLKYKHKKENDNSLKKINCNEYRVTFMEFAEKYIKERE